MYYPPIENNFWRQVLSQFEKISSEKIVYALLFLLPIFAVTVRHWVSNIFGVLALLSLVLLYLQRKERTELLKEEKILLWGFAVYFGVFILTSVVNGWGPLQTRYLGVEIRFLLFVPIYLAIRQMNYSAKWLLWGAVLAVIFTFYDAARDIFSLNVDVYRGAYSPLLTGPIILMFTALLAPYFYAKTSSVWQKLLLLLIVCLAFFVVSQTGARNAYLTAIVFCALFIVHQYKGIKRYVSIGAALLLIIGAYLFIDTVNERINLAYKEFTEYSAYKEPAKVTAALSSVGVRLEMWRATPIFFKHNPLFGVSRGNYSTDIKKYIKNGLLHQDVGRHAHPHNVYSETIISKGLIGLVSLLWITVIPLIILVNGYHKGLRTAFYGVVLISGYMVLSLTDASTFIKGNYSALYVVLLAVLFSFYIQEKQKLDIKSE